MRYYIYSVLFFLLWAGQTKASVVVVNGLTHHYTLELGAVQKGFISLQNTSEFPKSVKIYMLDYAYNENSKGAYSPKGSLVSSNASWVEILEGNITLGAKETRNIPYTIKVPNSLQKGGSRWSVLMIEPISHENTPQKNNFSISSVVRYAVLMVTDIAMEKNTQSIIHFNKAETLNNTMGSFLELELCNKGNVYHKLQLRAELYEEETGDEIEIKEKGVISLLPNAQKKYRISLETVPEGVYEVVVIATCANDEMFGYNYKLHKIE